MKSLVLFLLLAMESVADNARLEPSLIGVKDPLRAAYNWTMHCQGCHGVDATGSQGGAPNMVGLASQFLHSKKGRDYLARVPGVAFVELPDDQVAELLNWMLQTYDREHMPDNFNPYDAEELNRLRKRPLISRAFSERQIILEALSTSDSSR